MYVCAQVHKAFRPPLAYLFIAGAVFQCMRVKTCVWGGGAGKVSRCVLPFRAQRWHFWCHVLCRYVAFVVTTFPAGTVAFCAVDANVSSHNLLEAISHTHPRRV